MKSRFVWLGLLLSTILPAHAEEPAIRVGQPAPEFALPDQHHQTIRLSDYRGHWVVLYFYPKDDTPGCTTEACSFRDNINRLIAQKAVILGISVDDVDSHQAFTQKYDLPFPLLSDPEGHVAERYESLLNLWVVKFAKRHTFIIDPAGRIAKIYRDVTPEEHVATVLEDLKHLQQKTGGE
ncbi:MAG: peroxiredoxin [Hydrogenovibrio sp.]|nr:peroxiredoxin [Hydrogenovibrio sp.]